MDRTLYALALCVPCLIEYGFSQVPNSGFEDWAATGTFEEPTGWITTNHVAEVNDMPATCEKGSPGFAGNFYCSVTTRSGPDGIIVLGSMSTGNTDSNTRGYPYTERPEALIGQWKYNIMPSDLGLLSVTLSKWNTASGMRVTVGSGLTWVADSNTDWESFTVPINYVLFDAPDTAIVTIAASASPFAVVSGSTISLDDFQFDGSAGVQEVNALSDVLVFPSPTSGPLTISTSEPLREFILQDLTGRTLWRRNATSGPTATMDLQGLTPGRYMLGITLTDGRRVVRSFVKE